MGLSEILSLFPAGGYKFIAKSVEGEWLKGEATLSHELPCAPTNLLPSGPSVANGDTVTISWDPVTNMLGIESEDCDGGDITVETYQVVVENLETETDFSIFLEAEDDDNQVTLPEEFVTPDSVYKYEVLAIAENGNQTIAESFFCKGTPSGGCALPEE
jgi:hypothetical protein